MVYHPCHYGNFGVGRYVVILFYNTLLAAVGILILRDEVDGLPIYYSSSSIEDPGDPILR